MKNPEEAHRYASAVMQEYALNIYYYLRECNGR